MKSQCNRLLHGKKKVEVFGEVFTIFNDVSKFKEGDLVKVLKRPEEIKLSSATNKSPLVIVTKSFLGPLTRIGVDYGTSELIYVEVLTKEGRNFNPGDHVEIDLGDDEVMVVADE